MLHFHNECPGPLSTCNLIFFPLRMMFLTKKTYYFIQQGGLSFERGRKLQELNRQQIEYQLTGMTCFVNKLFTTATEEDANQE